LGVLRLQRGREHILTGLMLIIAIPHNTYDQQNGGDPDRPPLDDLPPMAGYVLNAMLDFKGKTIGFQFFTGDFIHSGPLTTGNSILT
jgi:hypothetical protein